MLRIKRISGVVGWVFVGAICGALLLGMPKMRADAQELEPVEREWSSGYTLSEPLERSPADVESPSGHYILASCQEPGAEYPYEPYDWPDAAAQLELVQRSGASSVKIDVQNVRPKTYFTMWLRLRGKDINGNTFGGSPLSGSAGTALAPSSDLQALVEATGPGNGNDQNPNGFWSDENGNATFRIDLDFPIINGAYPFHRFKEFNPADERLKAERPAIYPVAIVGKDGPFTLRMVSHCTDNVGHGLSSADREWWFLWRFQ